MKKKRSSLHEGVAKRRKSGPSPLLLTLGGVIAVLVVVSFFLPDSANPSQHSSLPFTTNKYESITNIPTQPIRNNSSTLPTVPTTTNPVLVPIHYGNETHLDYHSTMAIIKHHPLFKIMSKDPTAAIDDVLVEMQQYPKCVGRPIMITMAKIGTPLYWQLVENFIYSMTKFDIVECSLMVCIADPHCVELCQQSSFPCYHYDDLSGDISAFQKIANLKLYAIPLAAAKGVNIFLVDLDVGFRQSPMLLVENFMKDDSVDILVQKDVSFVMNRTVVGWRTWYTKPVVNIGLFVFKGNYKVEFMFKRAWRIYQKHTNRLDQPGTDQSIIQDCLHKSHDHKKIRLSWGFFPDSKVALVDKIYKFETQNIELGGEIANSILTSTFYHRDAIAVHATCYEMKVKVPALKAVGAFWNPAYYDPNRRTLTMKLYYRNSRQLRSHINALAWLALATNRSLIIPNLLADESLYSTTYKHTNLTDSGHVMWPGWRVMKFRDDNFPLQVLEAGYYWRVKRDYAKGEDIPAPFILSTFETKANKLLKILLEHNNKTRIVLNVMIAKSIRSSDMLEYIENTLRVSVSDSVGIFSNYSFESRYSPPLVPVTSPVPNILFNGEKISVDSSIRACSRILLPKRGNRSCFDKCK